MSKTVARIWKQAELVDRCIYRISIPDQPEMVAIEMTDEVPVLGLARGKVKYRGQIMTQIAEFFLKATEDVMPNFLLLNPANLPMNMLLGEYCRPMPIKFIVRRYLSGNLYANYRSTDGMTPWGRLDADLPHYYKFRGLVLTPMVETPSGVQIPITESEIVQEGHLTVEELMFLREKSFDLFLRGEMYAAKIGWALASSAFEYGWDCDGNLLVTNNLLVPDCSCYWKTQDELFSDENPPVAEKASGYASSSIQRQAKKHGIDADDVVLTPHMRSEVYLAYLEFYRMMNGYPFYPVKKSADPMKVLERIFDFR
ncbi:MAG: hypothetical protein LBT19_01815 [Candidatus Nomurabacteria bacterium]|jgi:phosphoribosylaminoimidazole-succinocarboxamide synthase|nr:hypothetical protein [Candidatus Nomurabacteria bacterium]